MVESLPCGLIPLGGGGMGVPLNCHDIGGDRGLWGLLPETLQSHLKMGGKPWKSAFLGHELFVLGSVTQITTDP